MQVGLDELLDDLVALRIAQNAADDDDHDEDGRSDDNEMAD